MTIKKPKLMIYEYSPKNQILIVSPKLYWGMIVLFVITGLFQCGFKSRPAFYDQNLQAATSIENQALWPELEPLDESTSWTIISQRVSDQEQEKNDDVATNNESTQTNAIFREMVVEEEFYDDQKIKEQPKDVIPKVKAEKKSQSNHKSPVQSDLFLEAKKLFLHGKITQAKKIVESLPKQNEQSKKLLSEIYVWECMDWAQKGDFPKALTSCEKAFDVDRHKKAKVFIDEMDEHAKELYFEAYALEKAFSDRALLLYKDALRFAPKNSVWKKKAMQRVSKLK